MLALLRQGATDLRIRPKGNIPSLDFLRSGAILLVLSAHVGGFFPTTFLLTKLPFVSSGYTGVDLFFVLSGYLIGRQLWKELTRGNIRVGRFLLRRGLRIWPLYYFFVVGLWLRGLIGHYTISGIWSDFLCLSNYFHHQLDGGWSLSTEEQFYIIAPLALYFASRWWSGRKLIWLPVIWLAALPLVRWLMIGASTSVVAFNRIYEPMVTHSDGLAIGVILAWVSVHRSELLHKASVRTNLVILFAGLLIFAALRLASANIFGFSAWAFLYGALTAAMLRGLEFAGTAWSGFYILSRLSYGIYLNHQYVLGVLMPHLDAKLGRGWVAFVCGWTIGLTISLTCAFLTFSLIELPFLQVRDRWIAKAKGTAAVADSSADLPRLVGPANLQIIDSLPNTVSCAPESEAALGSDAK